jgi:hypothetical protein
MDLSEMGYEDGRLLELVQDHVPVGVISVMFSIGTINVPEIAFLIITTKEHIHMGSSFEHWLQ